MKNQGILFFVKYPQVGKVKTRLAHVIGKQKTLELYQCFVQDSLQHFHDYITNQSLTYKSSKIYICYTPKASANQIKNWLGQSYQYIPQIGSDLGFRMANAFATVFKQGADQLILTGSDIPDISSALINQAFNKLITTDCVIGPAFDGGYYLIGFNKNSFQQKIFNNINWSTSEVFDSTIQLIKNANLNYSVLPFKRDIDTIKDLEAFFIKNNKSALKTMDFLHYYHKVLKLGV